MNSDRANRSHDEHGFFINFPGPLLLIPILLVGFGVIVGTTLLTQSMPEPKRSAGNNPQATAPDNGAAPDNAATPQRPAAGTFRAWDSDQLPIDNSIRPSTEIASGELKTGPPAMVAGLETQQLRFRLPAANFCAWSADGKVLYVKDAPGSIARIDVPTWKITHRAQFNLPEAPVTGVTLTSEGLVVALRAVQIDNFRMRGVDGKTYVHIDPRTGKNPETFSLRTLILLDANELKVKKQYEGPSLAIAGSPQSPILCATDDGYLAKLIDIRDGHVVDKAGEASRNRVPQKGIKPLVCLDELLMSPDGKTLFHRGKMSDIEQTDISEGRFGATRKLTPAGGTVSNLHPKRVTMFMSHDGRYVGVPVSTSRQEPGGDGYSIIDITKDGTDPEEPLYAQRSTAFAFVGPQSRPVTNCGVMFVEPHVRVEYHDLLLPKRAQLGTCLDISPKATDDTHENCTFSGSPISDYVLAYGGGTTTAWVKLPPDQGELKVAKGVAIQQLSIRGFVPDKPLEFAADPPKDKFDTVEHLRKIPIDQGAAIACSPDGNRLYMVATVGLLAAFDTNTLREVRRVEVGKTPDLNFRLYMTKAGPLVASSENKPHFILLDSETLDAKGGFDLGSMDVVTSPSSYIIATLNAANDLEAYDVRTGQMVARYTPRQLARSEPKDIDNKLFQTKRTRALSISDDGKWLSCRYRCWHIFSISEQGLKPAGVHTPPEDNYPGAALEMRILPSKGICFVGGSAFEFPSMTPTTSNFTLPEKEEPLTFASNGLVYCRQEQFVDVHAFDLDGKPRFTGAGFENNYTCHTFIALPQRPERIFTLVDGALQVADLKPPQQQ